MFTKSLSYLCLLGLLIDTSCSENHNLGKTPLSGFHYSTQTFSFIAGVAITSDRPIIEEGQSVSFSVNPAFPSGLELDAKTGVLTGTPQSASPTSSYTVTATDGNATVSVQVMLTVVPTASLSFSNGPTFNFQAQQISISTSQTFVLSNAGGTPATGLELDKSQLPSAFLVADLSNACPTTLAPGDQCSLTVNFDPVSTGYFQGCLTGSYTNELGPQSVSLCLEGMGVSPANLAITGNSSFGAVYSGSTSSLVLTVSNNGSTVAQAISPAFINNTQSWISFSGGSYPGSGGTCGASLPPGANCNMKLNFAPTDALASYSANAILRLSYTTSGIPQVATKNLSGQAVVPGGFDLSFGSNGKASSITPTLSVTDLAIQPDGKILTFGTEYLGLASSTASGGQDWFVSRYNKDGSFDTHFGNKGTAHIAILSATSPNYSWNSSGKMLLQENSIILTGTAGDMGFGSTTAIARLDSSGNLDASFGFDNHLGHFIRVPGVQTYASICGPPTILFNSSGAVILPNGDYAIETYCNWDGTFRVAAFRPNGSVHWDQVVQLSPSGVAQLANGLVLLPNGTLLGFLGQIGGSEFLINLNSTGTFVSSFGSGGILTKSISGSDTLSSLAFNPDGSLILGGRGVFNGAAQVFLAKLSPGGVLDTSFGTAGIAIPKGLPVSLLVMPNGNILAASDGGYFQRFSPAGVIDLSIPQGATQLPADSVGGGIAVQSDGKILVNGGGYYFNYELSRLWP